AVRPARGAAPRDPAARPRRPVLRGRRQRARHHPARRPGPRVPRALGAAASHHERGGHPMSELSPDLHRLGAALEQAAADDVKARTPARGPLLRRPRVLLAVAAAIIVPSAAFAADQLLSTDDVAQSMPAGAWIFGGRTPTCTVVTENVEYRCVL